MSRRLEQVSCLMAGPVALLHRVCFPEDPWDPSAIVEILGTAGFFGRIAWENEAPAGFALARDLHKECEILSLGVLPERRREGVGAALLNSICVEARLRSAESIVLEVAVDNIAALALYAARGFLQVGRRRNYYRRTRNSADALVLRLELTGTSAAS
ncbi:MAG TPA: GNAT family N-acetyltransferase [Stellaceae bacterium]|jgi:ribosomal-protein-alanine N-acetyltransferase|nr:GNAT family N-acetyltransferase [Stellaceae bacterium]